MKNIVFLLLLMDLTICISQPQTNIVCTNLAAKQAMLGKHNPATYMAGTILNHPDSISKGINKQVSADSLHKYLVEMSQFKNRNTGSDTVSNLKGIGAARRWALKKFQQFSALNQNRLLPGYLQFDQNICSVSKHRDIMAVLPGMDTTDKSIILVEAHFDSRCAGLCDTACLAEGMEDNGSGSALVLELARVMSKYSFNHTIVFLLTISEEQGLQGAEGFANYALQEGISIKAVLNNDVVGGVICGHSASAPGCSGAGSVDSTHVRLFSFGSFNSPHKQLSRFIKLEYKEHVRPLATVPMTVHVMTGEDRVGRGGDHIPFRLKNFTAMRMTSANEHGDANVTNSFYKDRQHTSSDVLGLDTDSDNVIDSFFVDFNYLARNAVINGNAIGMAAIGPKTPDFTMTSTGGNLIFTITQQTQYQQYRIGLRTLTHDWDSVYTFAGTLTHTLLLPPANYIGSVASVDTNGVESLFSKELMLTVIPVGVAERETDKGLTLLQNKPNPADESTSISVLVSHPISYKEAFISIRDLIGQEIVKIPISLNEGVNDVQYDHGYHTSGTFTYAIVVDGTVIDTRKMVFTH